MPPCASAGALSLSQENGLLLNSCSHPYTTAIALSITKSAQGAQPPNNMLSVNQSSMDAHSTKTIPTPSSPHYDTDLHGKAHAEHASPCTDWLCVWDACTYKCTRCGSCGPGLSLRTHKQPAPVAVAAGWWWGLQGSGGWSPVAIALLPWVPLVLIQTANVRGPPRWSI